MMFYANFYMNFISFILIIFLYTLMIHLKIISIMFIKYFNVFLIMIFISNLRNANFMFKKSSFLILSISINILSKYIYTSFYLSSIYFINFNIFYKSIAFKKSLIFSRNYSSMHWFSSISISISQLYYISISLK